MSEVKCISCDWNGSLDDLNDNQCPDCGSNVEDSGYLECQKCGWIGYSEHLVSADDDDNFTHCPDCGSTVIDEN